MKKRMRRGLCALLAMLLLTLPLATLAEEDDPFDTGPIEPFEDTPDWAPDPNDPSPSDPNFTFHRIVVDEERPWVLKAPQGNLELKVRMKLTLEKTGSGAGYAGIYEGTMIVSISGEIKLKGMTQVLKIESSIESEGLGFVTATVVATENPIDPDLMNLRPVMEESYRRRFGKEMPPFKPIAASCDTMRAELEGMGSLSATVSNTVGTRMSGHLEESGKGTSSAMYTFSIEESGRVFGFLYFQDQYVGQFDGTCQDVASH